ncbi:MAG: c-type cytochrome [Tumebacillaceae bacterium]
MSFKGTLMVLGLFILGVAFTGFASYSDTVMHPKVAEAIDGKKLASQNCASCHGQDLKGMNGSANLHEKGQQLSVETIQQVIKDGVNGKMPENPGKLTDKEIEAVAKYITTLN